MEFMEEVLKEAPWSVSRAQLLDKCPHSYFLKYRVKAGEVESGAASRVGTTVHSVLEYGLRMDMPDEKAVLSAEKGRDEDAPTTVVEVPSHTAAQLDEKLPYLLDLFARSKRNNLGPEQIDVAAKMLPRVKSFCLSMQDVAAKRGVEVFYLEHLAALGADLKPHAYNKPGALVRGVVDFGFMTKDNVYVIIDHKTGKPKNMRDYEDQLRLYMLFALAHHPEADAVQCGINHTLKPKVDWGDQVIRTVVEREYQPWLGHYLNRLGIRLLSITDKGGKPKTGPLCNWCNFIPADLDTATLCPEGVEEIRQRPKGPRLAVLQ